MKLALNPWEISMFQIQITGVSNNLNVSQFARLMGILVDSWHKSDVLNGRKDDSIQQELNKG